MTPITERVARGAALLDAKCPGWWRNIALGKLQMASSCDCVLGQVFSHYSIGSKQLGLCSADAVIEHAFHIDPNDGQFAWQPLTALWKEEILNRRFPSTHSDQPPSE